MDIRILLVPVSCADHGVANIEAAFELGKAFGCHVAGLHVRPDPRAAIPYIGEGMTADVIQELCDAAERDSLDKCAKARAVFDDIRERASAPLREAAGPTDGVTAGWFEAVGDEAQAIAARGRIADLSVVGKPRDVNKDSAAGVLEGILFHSGRPVLVVPADCRLKLPRCVAIAWNGSAEAARAVAHSKPFITRADKVFILSVGESSSEIPDAAGLAGYLAWHGVSAEAVGIEETAGTVGAALLSAARDGGADMIVMGAYTHSRWREMILGGVTRYLLANTDLPLLLVH